MSICRKPEIYPGVHRSPDFNASWSWDKYLITLGSLNDDDPLLRKRAVPVAAFREHVLRSYFQYVDPSLLIEVEVKDYKKVLEPPVKVFWLAQIKKIAGYRALVRWVGCREDKRRDFWVNLGSADVHSVTVHTNENKEVFLPPYWLEQQWTEAGEFRKLLTSALSSCEMSSTLADSFEEDKKKAYTSCKLKVGQRVELLDCARSSRVRPARVKFTSGRRVCVQVLKSDYDLEIEDDDRQFGPDAAFWVDHSSFYLFHVGWAALNGYQIDAKKDYIKHASKIAEAIKNHETPPYAAIDATKEQLSEWKEIPRAESKWEKGMKFELMDPLGETIRDLSPATVLEVLQDGYLKVAADGPDAEDECIPLHCTSYLLFPVGYAEKNGIDLQPPAGAECFSWPSYLKQSKAIPAPESFFKPNPDPEQAKWFCKGARLEASDMCENVLICPGTVVGVKGRLVHVHFDGWEDTFDQFFDIDSNDIFPLGWCELHGYKLEAPKDEIEEPKTKKKR